MIKVNSRLNFLLQLSTYLPRNCKGAEIGVLRGDFSQEILKIIDPATLVLIDPYKQSEKRYGVELNCSPTAYSTENDYQDLIRKFEIEIVSGKVRVLRLFSFDAVKDFPDHTFDFIYIDGSHLYEDVKRDLNDWLPKLKEDGIMCGHDYIEAPDFGVITAGNEFCEEHNYFMLIFNVNGGDFALIKK